MLVVVCTYILMFGRMNYQKTCRDLSSALDLQQENGSLAEVSLLIYAKIQTV